MLNISNDKLDMLRKCLTRHRKDLVYVIDSKELIKVDQELGNELREAVLDEFLRIGLNRNSEPNEVGLLLEELIDDIGEMFE